MRRAGLASVLSAAALLVAAAPAGAGPSATAAGEELIVYLDTGKLEVDSSLSYFFQCGADCSVSATAQFLIPGPNPAPTPPVSGTFAANLPIEHVIDIGKKTRKAIKKDIKKVRLRTELTATNILTGEVDVDSEVFKFKK